MSRSRLRAREKAVSSRTTLRAARRGRGSEAAAPERAVRGPGDGGPHAGAQLRPRGQEERP
eukprot:14743627-Alexandrium_andersonii.AAC.1